MYVLLASCGGLLMAAFVIVYFCWRRRLTARNDTEVQDAVRDSKPRPDGEQEEEDEVAGRKCDHCGRKQKNQTGEM